jgi:protoporphyrinogen oxidase
VTFEDWILAHLGPGIARYFMVPYNTKLWTVHPREMVGELARKFVPVPKPEQVVRGALGIEDSSGIGYNVRFLYPREGGIGALARALCARLPEPPRYGVEPTRIDVDRRTARLSDGQEIAFESLVSTISLKDLVTLCDAVPAEITAAGDRLRHNRVTYYDVGIRDGAAIGPRPPSRAGDPRALHWIYFPEERFPFYRVGCYTAVLPTLSPAGCRSLYVEVAHQADVDVRETWRRCAAGLIEAGLLDSTDDVLFADAHEIPHAYIIPDAHYDAARAALFAYFKAARVWTIGRYGKWDYASMEDALVDGRQAAEAIAA